MCTARLFLQGVDLLALKFYQNMVVPLSTILCVGKLETRTGLPDGEDDIPLRFLVLTQYRIRRTDGRTDMP